jgi:hypothetical protein
MFFDPFCERVRLRGVERIDLAVQDQRGIGLEVDRVIIFSCGQKPLCFCFREYLGMPSVFIGDCFEVFVLICFDRPFLGEVSSVDDYLVSFLPFMCPC